MGSSPSLLLEGSRLHSCIEGRYISCFRHHNILSAIDSTCYHAGGPLALGEVSDIEELGISVVSCPWHKFKVDLADGTRAYQGVNFVGGKPVPGGWLKGKAVQRRHGKLISNYLSLRITDIFCACRDL